MKKLNRIIMLLIFVLLLTGCTIKSNITILDDGKIKEEVTITEEADAFFGDANKVLDSYLSKYKTVLDFRKYENRKIIEEDKAGIVFSNSYDNICSYFQDTAFNQYVYKHIKCTEDDRYYIIENDTPYIPYCSDCSDWPKLDDISLSIKLPFDVSEQNADEINENIYTWKYGKEVSDKNFYLKISKRSFIEYEENILQEQKNKKRIKKELIVIGIIIIVIILIGLGSFLRKKYQENKLEY